MAQATHGCPAQGGVGDDGHSMQQRVGRTRGGDPLKAASSPKETVTNSSLHTPPAVMAPNEPSFSEQIRFILSLTM